MSKVALLLLLCAGLGMAADLKVVTRQTSSSPYNHPTKETIYIQGQRYRREFRGNGVTTAAIYQCDLHRMISLDEKTKTYRIWPLDERGLPKMQAGLDVTPATHTTRSGNQVTVLDNVTDTGERKDFFGVTAKHLIRTRKFEPHQTSCADYGDRDELVDGWYIEAPAGVSCEPSLGGTVAVLAIASAGHCVDDIQGKHSGPHLTGIPVQQTTTIGGERRFSRHLEPVEISQQPLDPKLFDIPPDYTEYSAVGAAFDYYWRQVKEAVARIF